MNRKIKLLMMVVVMSATPGGVAAAASSPSIATGSTSSVSTSSAVLHGTVNPNSSTTYYRFEWGLTKAYGLESPVKSAGAGTKNVAVQATASGLLPGTVYHYRLDALNKYGGGVGADRTFRTAGNPPPDAGTGPATDIGTTFATVTGVINPHGQATTWVFQYGQAPAYSAQTFGGVVPAGISPVIVAQQLRGLTPGTFFHYRVVALHGSSVVQYGQDQAFMTFPSPRPVPRVPAGTTPHRARSRPYVFTTSGRVIGPQSIPQSISCFSNATVNFYLGRKRSPVASSLFTVQPNCTFSGQTTFNNLPGRGNPHRRVTLRIEIHFRGNGYLAPANARREFVTLG